MEMCVGLREQISSTFMFRVTFGAPHARSSEKNKAPPLEGSAHQEEEAPQPRLWSNCSAANSWLRKISH